jgi:ankyrin repeat protein
MTLGKQLCQAAEDGDVARVRELAALGADVNERRAGDGWGALHMAAQDGHVEVAKALIEELGADKEARDVNGARPIHVATIFGHVALVKALLALEADKEAQAADGYRPLHIAAQGGHLAVVEALVLQGVQLDALTTDAQPVTANTLSLQCGHPHVAAALVFSGAAVAAAPAQGACAACGSKPSASAAAFMQCGRCKAVKYCGKLCQRNHWPVHKASCAEVGVRDTEMLAA